jgi:regulator of protease activity HflC (stomatin/prohibitin superfamily)
MIDLSILSALGPAIAGVGAVASSGRVVHEDERGMKLRFGKVVRHKSGARKGHPKVLLPGFRLLIPAVDRLKKIHVRASTVNLPIQAVMLKDRTVFEVGAMVIVRVRDTDADIYNALFETDDLPGSVSDYCAAELRDLLAGMTYADMTDPSALARQAQARVEPTLASWGLSVQTFKLTDCSPTAATERLVLIGTDAEFRVDALMAAANRLNVGGVSALDAGLAAALIGTPVAAQVQATSTRPRSGEGAHEGDEDE